MNLSFDHSNPTEAEDQKLLTRALLAYAGNVRNAAEQGVRDVDEARRGGETRIGAAAAKVVRLFAEADRLTELADLVAAAGIPADGDDDAAQPAVQVQAEQALAAGPQLPAPIDPDVPAPDDVVEVLPTGHNPQP